MDPVPTTPVTGSSPAASVPIPQSQFKRPENPSQYMRTYAKDVASLTGTAAPVVSKPNDDDALPGVKLPEVDASITEGSVVRKSEDRPEVLVTSKEDEDIFVQPAVVPPTIATAMGKLPASVAPPAPAAPAPGAPPLLDREAILARLREKSTPAVKPVLPPGTHREINLLKSQAALVEREYTPPISALPAPTTTPAPVTISEPLPTPQPERPVPTKEQLQPTRVATSTVLEGIRQAQAPVVPTSLPVRATTPVASPQPAVRPFFIPDHEPLATKSQPSAAPIEPVQPAPPQPRPPITATPTPSTPVFHTVPPSAASPIHTYSSDFSDRIDERRASTFSVLAAEQDSGVRRVAPAAPSKLRSILRIALPVLLVLFGIGTVTGAYLYYRTSTTVPATIARVPSLIAYDEAVELEPGTGTLMQALVELARQPLVAGNVLVTYTTVSTTTKTGTFDVIQPGDAFIAGLGLGAPDILLRNIDPASTVGVVQQANEPSPYFIFKVTSYERTFAGMLAWEPAVLANLSTLYPPFAPEPVALIPTASSTARTSTSTIRTAQPPARPIYTPGFIDTTVANRDVRAYRDASGNIVLLYGYHDKETLVLARNEAAFAVLIDRLSASVGR